MSRILELATDLIQRQSITPEDADCQRFMADILAKQGFTNHDLPSAEVKNLWSRRGNTSPVFVFAGHTDVVPTGPLENWCKPPFAATVEDGILYGRGAADMKGSIAAMLAAVERFVQRHPDHKGSIAFLVTSDEEGPATDGTVKVVEYLESHNEKIDFCLVGEPSSTSRLGDVIKNGRRGSLSGKLVVRGKQGHIAYPHLARNPIHEAAPLIAELSQVEWDQGNDFFPPTSFQISNIHAGTGASNVIPGHIDIDFNFRFSTESTAESLQQRVVEIIGRHCPDYELSWSLSGHPFLTPEGELVNAIKHSIQKHCGYETELSTSGGTSDGRFIAPTGAQVCELGPLNKTIHQIDECVSVTDLELLSTIYESILEQLLT